MFFFCYCKSCMQEEQRRVREEKRKNWGEKSVVKRRENVEIVQIVSCWNGRFLLNQESV